MDTIYMEHTTSEFFDDAIKFAKQYLDERRKNCLTCEVVADPNNISLGNRLRKIYNKCPHCKNEWKDDQYSKSVILEKIESVDDIEPIKKYLDGKRYKCLTCDAINDPNNVSFGNYLKEICGNRRRWQDKWLCELCYRNDIAKRIKSGEEVFVDVGIDKYRDTYMISNKGNCLSKKKGKILSSRIINYYNIVSLWSFKEKKKNLFVHKLVYLSFNKDYDNTKCVHHVDDDKRNNNLENLKNMSLSEIQKMVAKNNPDMTKQRMIQAFNKNNEFVKEFNNTREAVEHFSLNNACGINDCLRGVQKSAGDHFWKLKNEKVDKCVTNLDGYEKIGIIGNNDFSNYLINREGIIINEDNNNQILETHKDGEGYKIIHLCASSKEKMFKVHRLLGRQFLDNGKTFFDNSEFVINHKDKNKSNNNVLNLEFVPYRQNSIHASGIKVEKIDPVTGNVLATYNSISEAAESVKQYSSAIIDVCHGKQKTAGGFKWRKCEQQ